MVSTDTIILIAVCGAVGVLLCIIVVVHVVKRVASTSNPLPPVQPLAHHREQQSVTLPRSQTWYSSQNHLPIPGTTSAKGSRTSLLLKNVSPVDTDSATTCSPLSDENFLPPPSSSFRTAQPGSSASSLGSTSASEPSHPPLPANKPPPPRLPRARSNASAARRHRPLSDASSRSTIHSKASRNTLRGTPHGPHSHIEIILPAPLAAEMAPSASNLSSQSLGHIDEGYNRKSVVDRWA